MNARGSALPQKAVSHGICAEADIPPASLAEWTVARGPAPKGTAAPRNCADSAPIPCGTLTANHELTTGQSLTSCNDDFTLNIQGDGNLVLYQDGRPLWASNTVGSGADEAIMKETKFRLVYQFQLPGLG